MCNYLLLSFSRSFDWNFLVVALDDHDPTASVDTFGRRIWGGAMRPPLTPLRFRFAGGRVGPRRGRTSSVGGRAGPFSRAAAEGSAASVGGRAGPFSSAAADGNAGGAGAGAGAGGIASSPLPSSSDELP